MALGLLSGSTVNQSSPTGYAKPTQVQYQLGPTPSTSTGFTLFSTGSIVNYTSSLGNVNWQNGRAWSTVQGQNLVLYGTGTSAVVVAGGTTATNTASGALSVQGDASVWGVVWTGADANIHGVSVGQGWSGFLNQGQNNIAITGILNTATNNYTDGENSVVIGYNSLGGLQTALKVVAIGTNVITSGSNVTRTVAIGDSALKLIGTVQSIPVGTITLINNVNPVIVTVNNHKLSSGTYVTLYGVNGSSGTPPLNNGKFFVKPIDINRVELFYDVNQLFPVDGTGFTPYVSSGTLAVVANFNDNIAIGYNAADSLINGQQNFFLGDNLAVNLTTGSYNVLIGHDVANNMITGNANISIGGDQLVDGLDNQVSIASLLYYDGKGYTQINSNLGAGIGSWATATMYVSSITNITNSNPVTVSFTNTYSLTTGTEIVITGVNGTSQINYGYYYTSYLNSNTVSLFYDWALTMPVDGTSWGAYANSGTISKLEPTGALSILGGVGVKGNLIVANPAEFHSRMYVRKLISGTITTATNLAGGALGSIPYQSSTGTTLFIPIGQGGTVLTSNGSTATWSAMTGLNSGYATTASNIYINTATQNLYYPTLAANTASSGPIYDDQKFTYVVTTTNTSSYWTSGTNILNVPGSIYSADGNPDQNNWLYTPRVTISIGTPPANPRIGDFWIDPSGPYELQYVSDGGNFIWVQFTGL